MSIKGIGIDIVSITRIEQALQRHGDNFVNLIYTPAEQQEASQRPGSWIQYYAGRWAAKEAVAKALGTGFGNQCGWKDVEILNDVDGKPWIRLIGRALQQSYTMKIQSLWVSISHERQFACAMVIAEG